ncbi:MAG: SDR family NAD(P)-dependent oxidoreductase [Desulfobacterales bacterium]
MKGRALLIGNSDGIGLGITKELLKREWTVVGFSRSKSPIEDRLYEHITCKVQDDEYPAKLKSVLENSDSMDLCIYCAGIGEMLDLSDMAGEAEIVSVNLLGMVVTASNVIPLMVKKGKGHFIGLSSPSYHASKAGFSNYLESLALALRPKSVHVSNVRFGFVDTKMAKGDVRPFMMSIDRAVSHLVKCIQKKPIRYTAPRVVIPLVKFRSWFLRLRILFSKLKT